jgi:hypothetical protein
LSDESILDRNIKLIFHPIYTHRYAKPRPDIFFVAENIYLVLPIDKYIPQKISLSSIAKELVF